MSECACVCVFVYVCVFLWLFHVYFNFHSKKSGIFSDPKIYFIFKFWWKLERFSDEKILAIFSFQKTQHYLIQNIDYERGYFGGLISKNLNILVWQPFKWEQCLLQCVYSMITQPNKPTSFICKVASEIKARNKQ